MSPSTLWVKLILLCKQNIRTNIQTKLRLLHNRRPLSATAANRLIGALAKVRADTGSI